MITWERREERDYECSKAVVNGLAVAWISRYGPSGQRGGWWIHALMASYKSVKWDRLEAAEAYVEEFILDWITGIPGVTYNKPGSLR